MASRNRFAGGLAWSFPRPVTLVTMPSCRTASPCALVGLLLGATVLGVTLTVPGESPGPSAATSTSSIDHASDEDILQGLWTRYDSRGEGDPLRFWYFHGDGKGLYRYGKVGLANTHSFDYSLAQTQQDEDDELYLRFRKTGEQHRLRIVIERDDEGRLWLIIQGDPREPGARYRKVESDLDLEEAAAMWANRASSARHELGDRIWIDYDNYATGGAGFHMYQLSRTAIDGRGVGWFHRGDFDEWSTESLTYRIDGDRIELFFDLREEPNVTEYRLLEGEQGRVLELATDPRDFWATHRYDDGGKSFGSAAFGPVVGFEGLVRAALVED